MSAGQLTDEEELDEQRQHQKDRRQREEDARALREEDLVAVMSFPAGRRFVWRLMGDANTFGSSFAGEAPLTSAFNEGRRSSGVALMIEVQRLAAFSYAQMLQEQLEELRRKTPEK